MAAPIKSATKPVDSAGGGNPPPDCARISEVSPDISLPDLNPLFDSHGKVVSVNSYKYQEAVGLNADSETPFMRCDDFDEPSTMDKLLGNGKVADILLWRDEKKTFFCFMLLVLLYHTFFIAGGTFISSVSKLLLLFTVLLCGHCVLPLSIYGFTIDRLSSSCFEISDVDVRNALLTMTCLWNELGRLTKTLAEGEDWSALLKVSVFLYFCKLIVLNSLSMVIGAAIVLSFTLCFVYEQYEEEIDRIATVIGNTANNAALSLGKNLPMPLSKAFSVFKPLVKKESIQPFN